MSWPIVPLEKCTRIVGGATPSTSVPEFWDGDILWATPKDLSDLEGTHLDVTARKISDRGLASCAAEVLPAGSVLFSSRAPIGHVAINRVPVSTNQGFKSFIPDRTKLEAGYLFWWLKANRTHLQSMGNGATFKELSNATVARVEIPLPPLPEQSRIAAILDRTYEIAQKRKRSIDRAHSFVHAVFYELFGDPAQNNRKWPIVEVGAVTDCIVPGRDKPKSFSGDTPWITTSELVHLGETGLNEAKFGLTKAEITQVRARVVPAQSVIITCVGDLGVASMAKVPMVINQQLHAYQCSDNVIPEYLMYALSYQVQYMRRMATQTTLPYMNKSVCNGIPIQLPPLSLQREFSEIFKGSLRLHQKMSDSLARVESLFASLQQRAFTGELVITDADRQLAIAS
jgi:type I restriction enzyme, S subunit